MCIQMLLCSNVAQLLNFMKYSSVVVTLFWIWDFKKWSWCQSFCTVVSGSCLVQASAAGTHWNSNSRNQNGAFGIALRGNTAPEVTTYPETSSYFSVPSIQSSLLMSVYRSQFSSSEWGWWSWFGGVSGAEIWRSAIMQSLLSSCKPKDKTEAEMSPAKMKTV